MLTLTYYKRHTKRVLKVDFKRFLSLLLAVAVVVSCMGLCVDVCKFPEKYSTTYRYQLKNHIKNGDQKAVDYYEKNYISKGVYLYGENN